jgi:hypothetical protein
MSHILGRESPEPCLTADDAVRLIGPKRNVLAAAQVPASSLAAASRALMRGAACCVLQVDTDQCAHASPVLTRCADVQRCSPSCSRCRRAAGRPRGASSSLSTAGSRSPRTLSPRLTAYSAAPVRSLRQPAATAAAAAVLLLRRWSGTQRGLLASLAILLRDRAASRPVRPRRWAPLRAHALPRSPNSTRF